MSSGLKSFLQRWLINTLAVLITTYVLRTRITYGEPIDLLTATLILGILNAFLRPLLLILSLPLLIFTLGLFTIVINAVLLLLVSYVMGPTHFDVKGFWSAFWGALIISIVSLVLNLLTRTGDSRVRVQKQQAPPPKNNGGGSGPVIDV